MVKVPRKSTTQRTCLRHFWVPTLSEARKTRAVSPKYRSRSGAALLWDQNLAGTAKHPGVWHGCFPTLPGHYRSRWFQVLYFFEFHPLIILGEDEFKSILFMSFHMGLKNKSPKLTARSWTYAEPPKANDPFWTNTCLQHGGMLVFGGVHGLTILERLWGNLQ